MLTGKPLFKSREEVDMIIEIFHKFGVPTEKHWDGISKLMERNGNNWPNWKTNNVFLLSLHNNNIPKLACDLLLVKLFFLILN